MSPDKVGGIFISERCGACSGKSAEIKMGVREANGHPFDLASPFWGMPPVKYNYLEYPWSNYKVTWNHFARHLVQYQPSGTIA